MSFKHLLFTLVAIVLSSCTNLGKLSVNVEDATLSASPPTHPKPALDSLTERTLYLGEQGSKAMRLGPNVNTPYSDFAPLRYADRLYFTSMAVIEKGKKPLYQVISVVGDNGSSLWSENADEPGINTSHVTFTADGQKAYFMRCKEDVATGGQACEIYTRERAYQGYWLPLKRLPTSINLEGYINTQPSIAYNQSLKKEALYFVSNRPGGMGGMDIWCSPLERNGTYGKPFPLPINTKGDDVTPFFHQPTQVLYFSSTLADTASGFDIFKSANTGTNTGESNWTSPERLGAPFNSQFDDLYFSCHTASRKAYFASNRPGCVHPDPEQHCDGYDIFEADLPTELHVLVFNAIDNEEVTVKGALTEIGTGLAVQEEKSDKAGQVFLVEPNKQYELGVEEAGFFTVKDTIEIELRETFSTIQKNVYLHQKTRLVVKALSALDSLPIEGVSFRYLKANGELAESVEHAGSSTEHSITVGTGDKFLIEATKEGYAPASLNFEAPVDGPSVTLYERIYLQPFTNLPLPIFFDNDQPRWVNPKDTDTRWSYDQTLQQYLQRKEIFIEKFTESLTSAELEAARHEVSNFFEDEVQANFEKLDELFSEVETYLKKGHRLEIQAIGEASPLASQDYNLRLIARRVSSLRNYLKVWKKGALRSYLYSGKLTVTSIAQNPAATTVTDPSLQTRRWLEFSPEASRLRKVTIQRIRLQDPKA